MLCGRCPDNTAPLHAPFSPQIDPVATSMHGGSRRVPLGDRVDILLAFVGFNVCSIILLVKRQMINLLPVARDITFHQWVVRHPNIFIAFNVQLFSDLFGDV